ncbi:MAG: CCxxC motif-containing NuoF prefix domain-containing protein [Bacillota bacterium]
MDKFSDPCCKACTHSRQTPCAQFVECCLSGPLCHNSVECRAAREGIVAKLAHSPAFRERQDA